MNRLITYILLLFTFVGCTKNISSEDIIQDKSKTGSAEIRTSIETYNYAKSIGFDLKSATIDGENNGIQFIDDYVLIGRKNNYPIGLHNMEYSLNTEDSAFVRRIPNFPIYQGQTTIYYDESFLVEVSFDIVIDPSFDREYKVDIILQ